jgi:hypothetical protein
MVGRKIISLAATLVFVAPTQLFGQDTLTLAPGVKVRVTAPSIGVERMAGTITSVDATARSLEIVGPFRGLLRSRRMETVPLDSVTTLEVRTHESVKPLGFILGFIAGAIVGAAIGSGWGEDSCQGRALCADKGTTTIVGAVEFGALGGLVGYLVARGDRWQAVPLDAVRISFSARTQGSASLSVSIQL